ncbi:Dopey, N-terminal domain-containing protein [Cryptosporidium felis]|nr:Dopey, N-terminal domain-containing protein [Cryptosporidium felis]
MTDFTWSRSETKKYESEIFNILQSFEKAQEWADLSNCLQRLKRCISREYLEVPGVPLKETISKRLAQCLNPSLPSGVHTKALETYESIFEKIGRDELTLDLALYGSGLFPFFAHSSTQVKPIFLDLIDNFFLPLGPTLLPCLSGLLVGLLPGVEDSKSECYDRVMRTFHLISSDNCVGEKNFMCALWVITLRTSQVRYSALEVIMNRFPSVPSEKNFDFNKLEDLIPCRFVFIKALESCIEDENILVKRQLLDFMINFIPLRSNYDKGNYIDNILPYKSKINLLRKVLKLFLFREWSLTRRVIQWISNDKTNSENGDKQLDNKVTKLFIVAIIEELNCFASSLPDLQYTSQLGNHLRIMKSQQIKLITNSNSFSNSNNFLQPIRMVNSLFEEYDKSFEQIFLQVITPILIYAKEFVAKCPELKNSMINECKSLIKLSNLDPIKVLSLIYSDIDNLFGNINMQQLELSGFLKPTILVLKETILFLINSLLDEYSIKSYSFYSSLFKLTMKVLTSHKMNSIEMIALIDLCLFSISGIKAISGIENTIHDEESKQIIEQSIETLFSSLYKTIFPISEVSLRSQLYKLFISINSINHFGEIIKKTSIINTAPFEDFPIPNWLYNFYMRCSGSPFNDLKFENYLIDDLFNCLEILVNVFFDSKFFLNKNLIPVCFEECTLQIINLLWDYLNSEYNKFHRKVALFLIKIEKWFQENYNSFTNIQFVQIKGNSLLSQFLVSQLSLYEIEKKINNIMKLSTFIKHSTDSLYLIPSEVIFLIIEGLDSCFLRLKSACSTWVFQAIENSKLIFDHIINDLVGPDTFRSLNKKLIYNEELDFARMVYTLERLNTLISLENVNIIEILMETIIDESSIPHVLSEYEIENYLDAFIFLCVTLFTTEHIKSEDFRVQFSAINTLSKIFIKSTNISYRFAGNLVFENKLVRIISLIINPILEGLQYAIVTKRFSLQMPLIQLLHSLLLIQIQNKEIILDNFSWSFLPKNDKLIPTIILALQQFPSISPKDENLIDLEEFKFISSYLPPLSSSIKPFIDLTLQIFEELEQEALIQNASVVLCTLCLELIMYLNIGDCSAAVHYLDSVLKVLVNIIGISPFSNSLTNSKPKTTQTNPGFVQSLFIPQREFQYLSFQAEKMEFNSLRFIPQLLKYPLKSGVSSISNHSKIQIIKNTTLILFCVLIEAFNFLRGIELIDDGLQSPYQMHTHIFSYIDSIAFILAWNYTDGFIFSGISCWTHINQQIKAKSALSNQSNSRNISIISIFQLQTVQQIVSLPTIFSIVGNFLSYSWQHNNEIITNLNEEIGAYDETQDKNIPNYVIFFSRINIDNELICCTFLWKETFAYHFLYTILITHSFFKNVDEFVSLWGIMSSLLNSFLSKVKQPKNVLWFATILSALDGCMALSRECNILDRKIVTILEEKKMVKNLINLINMIIYLVHEDFSSKVSNAVQPEKYDKLPPLPPSIEAILQSIKFDFPDVSQSSLGTLTDKRSYPKSVVSDDPSLLFSYYSMGFLIMYNIEVTQHPNSKRLYLRSIWGSSIVKSLEWAFEPLLKRNDITNMIHKYYLLLHIDTFPFRVFPEYLSGIKKPIIDVLNSPKFFCMDRRTFRCWMSIISRLVLFDSTSISAVGRVNILETYVPTQSLGIFSTKVAELQNRSSHIKRLAFLIFCCPQNTFQLQLPFILERLVENLKLAPENISGLDTNINPHFVCLAEQVILCLRVLLLKVHYQSLMPLWPIVLAELIKIFRSDSHQRLKISAMKFVDLASLLDIPEFHLYQWIFVTDFFNTEEIILNKEPINERNFSPFCHISDGSIESTASGTGVNMDTLDGILNTEIPRHPLIMHRNKTETDKSFNEIALYLNNNCLLNSIRSSHLDNEKILRSIENDFLDFPDNLLDWSYICDPITLYSTISNQKNKLKSECNELTRAI